MLGECQVAAPLMARRAAHGALRLAHRRFQPGQGVGIQLAGLRLGRKPQRPSQCQFGHETLVLALALFAPAASRPGQNGAVRRQRGRQAAPCGHASTVGQGGDAGHLRSPAAAGSHDIAAVEALLDGYLPQGAGAMLLGSACELVGPHFPGRLIDVARRHPGRPFVARMLANIPDTARLLGLLPAGGAAGSGTTVTRPWIWRWHGS